MPPLLFMTTRILIQLEWLLVTLQCYSYSNDKFLSSLGEKKEAYVTNLTTNASPPWPRGPWKHGGLGMIIFRKRRTAQSHTTPYLTSTHTLLSSPLILQWEGMHTHMLCRRLNKVCGLSHQNTPAPVVSRAYNHLHTQVAQQTTFRWVGYLAKGLQIQLPSP